jgi:hypothetical protein
MKQLTPIYTNKSYPDLDPLIKPFVMFLRNNGIDTQESCDGHNRVPAGIWGSTTRISDIGKIQKLLTEVTGRCYCGTCSMFDIIVRLHADATGIYAPGYIYHVKFDKSIKQMLNDIGAKEEDLIKHGRFINKYMK